MTYNEILNGTFGKYMPEGVKDRVIVPIPVEDEQPVGPTTEFSIPLLSLSYLGQDSWNSFISKEDFEGIDFYDDNQYAEAQVVVNIPAAGIENLELYGQVKMGEYSDMAGKVTFYIDSEGTDASYDNLIAHTETGSIHGSGTITCVFSYNGGENENSITFTVEDMQFILD